MSTNKETDTINRRNMEQDTVGLTKQDGMHLKDVARPNGGTVAKPRALSPLVTSASTNSGSSLNKNQSNSTQQSQNGDDVISNTVGGVDTANDDDVEVPVPPDGGWGWMVVLGSFIVHIIADGMAYSFGVVVVALLEQFPEAGREEMGFIGAIMVGLTMGVGKWMKRDVILCHLFAWFSVSSAKRTLCPCSSATLMYMGSPPLELM